MYQYEHPHPAVTTDIVIFTIRDNALQLLLIKRGLAPFKGRWALPGGFVQLDEDLETGAKRELWEETGLSDVYLEQLYTFGAPKRDPRERVITVAYFALMPTDKVTLAAATDAAAARWYPVDDLPKLAFDHERIVAVARERLAAKLRYSTIALQFMPATFTLSELQRVYELIQGEALDKRNFRKQLLALDIIEPTGKKRATGAHRPAALYKAKRPGELEFTK